MTKISRAMTNNSHDMDSLLERGDITGTKAYRDHENENEDEDESSTEGTDEDSSDGDVGRTDHCTTRTTHASGNCRCKIMLVSLLGFVAAGLLFLLSLDSSGPCAGNCTMATLANGTDCHNATSTSQSMVAPIESNATSIADDLDRKINLPVAPNRPKAPKGTWYTTEDSRTNYSPDSTREKTKPGKPTVPENRSPKKTIPKATKSQSEKDSPLSSNSKPEKMNVDQIPATTKTKKKTSEETKTSTQKNTPKPAPDSLTMTATAKIDHPPAATDKISSGWFQNAIQTTRNPGHPKTYEEEIEVLQDEENVDQKMPGAIPDEPKQLRGQHPTSKNEKEAKQKSNTSSLEKTTKKNELNQKETPEKAPNTVEQQAKKKSPPTSQKNTIKKNTHPQMNQKKKTKKKAEQGKM